MSSLIVPRQLPSSVTIVQQYITSPFPDYYLRQWLSFHSISPVRSQTITFVSDYRSTVYHQSVPRLLPSSVTIVPQYITSPFPDYYLRQWLSFHSISPVRSQTLLSIVWACAGQMWWHRGQTACSSKWFNRGIIFSHEITSLIAMKRFFVWSRNRVIPPPPLLMLLMLLINHKWYIHNSIDPLPVDTGLDVWRGTVLVRQHLGHPGDLVACHRRFINENTKTRQFLRSLAIACL